MSDVKGIFVPTLGRMVRLGRKRPPANCPSPRLGHYLLKALPPPPPACDYTQMALASLSQVYLNDQLGCCHDSETEVLTEHGWKKWPDYDGESLLGTMNVHTGLLEFQAPEAVQRFEYHGRMIFPDHKRLDFALTPNHRMLYRPYQIPYPYVAGESGYGSLQFGMLDYLPPRCAIPGTTTGFLGTGLRSLQIGQRIWNGDDFLRLLAVILSDGYVRQNSNRNVISFCCFRPSRREMISSLADRLGIKEAPYRPGVWTFTDGALANWLRVNCFVGDQYRSPFKRVPDLVKVAEQKQIEEFLLFFGDQHTARDGERHFYSSSTRMIDDLQELLLRVGKRGGVCSHGIRNGGMSSEGKRIKSRYPSFTLMENLSTDVIITPGSKRCSLVEDDYKGEVFCATVPNSTLITRRNKKILISGNCVIAGGAHVRGVTTGNVGTPVLFSQSQIIEQYSAIGGYVPGNPATDRGCNEQDALNYWAQHGYPDGVKLAGWLRVNASNQTECETALWLFENVFFGIELPDAWLGSQMPRGNGFVWDSAGSPDPNNGHCVVGCGFNAQGIIISTWGMIGTMTWRAVQQYAVANAGGELYTLLSPDMVNKAQQKAPNGFDWSQLIADFDSMGGNIPVPPSPPQPTPPVPPSPPQPTPPVPPAPLVPPVWQELLALIESLLAKWGPYALPIIEAWVSTLPLPASVIAAIDVLLEHYLGKKPTIRYKQV